MVENTEIPVVLNKMKSIIDKNEETGKTLRKFKQVLKESKDRCNEDLKHFYLATIKKVEEAYEETRDQVEQEHDKLRGKLEEREKMIHKSTYALMPQILKLAGSNVSEISLNESKEILEANQEAVDIGNAYQTITFNFIPNEKLRNPKLGHLQLCGASANGLKITREDSADGLKTVSEDSVGGLKTTREDSADGLKTVREDSAGELKTVREDSAGELKTVRVDSADGLKTTREDSADGMFSVGDVCVAKWTEDEVWYNGIVTAVGANDYVVKFSDYGNTASVKRTHIVRSPNAIPKHVTKDQIDEHVKMKDVKMIEDGSGLEKLTLKTLPSDEESVEKPSPLFSKGESCVAKWEDDQVWYNGKITDVNQDGSFVVNFVDYGNSETVFASSIVKDGSKIPAIIPLDQIDVNVDTNTPETRHESVGKASKSDFKESSLFSCGDTCVARWDEDLIWYNGKITAINADGSFMVNFVDYGNTAMVTAPFIVRNISDIPKSVSKDEIDENVYDTPDPAELRRRMTEAAEKRLKEAEGKGLKDPEGAMRRIEAKAKAARELEKLGGGSSGLMMWQINQKIKKNHACLEEKNKKWHVCLNSLIY